MNEKLTIITPTHNRANSLPRLYESLCKQTVKDFIWLVMDDGSTDETPVLVEKWKEDGKMEIDYHWHSNVHKVITMFRGFEQVKTPYHFRVDSDDEIPENSVEVLLQKAKEIENDDSISSVIGRVQDQNGNIIGTAFPCDPLDTTAFLMRNKYKVKGIHAGLQKTSAIRALNYDMEIYAGKGYLPDFWNYSLDAKYVTRFINDVIYTYHLDLADNQSNTNARKFKKNAFGLMLAHLNFVKSYHRLYFSKYPLPVFTQLFRYLYAGLNVEGETFATLLKKLDGFFIRLAATALFLPVMIYNRLKPMRK